MKKSVITLLACILLSSANGQTKFQTAIGDSAYSTGYGIAKTADGGYAIAGKFSKQGYVSGACVMKLNDRAELDWIRTLGDSTGKDAFSVVQTSDGGYAMAGRSSTEYPLYGLETISGLVAKLDSLGAVQWVKTIGGDLHDEFRSIIQTKDGNLVVVGFSSTFCNHPGRTDYYLLKLDVNTGVIIWTKSFGGPENEFGIDIVESADSGLVIAGYSGALGSQDIYCVKTSSTGDLLWTTHVGGTNHDWAYGLTNTIDGGVALVGHTSSFGAGGDDVYVVKLDSNGDLEWTRTIGGSGEDWGLGIAQASNGEYVVAGYSNSFSTGGDFDCYIIKLDASGNLIWTRTLGGALEDKAWDVIIDDDGGYAIVGFSRSFATAYYTMYLVKLDANGDACSNQGSGGGTVGSGGVSTRSVGGPTIFGGVFYIGLPSGTGGTSVDLCSITGVNESAGKGNEFIISPTLSSGAFTVILSESAGPKEIEVYNSIGKKVFSDRINNELRREINLSNAESGMYFVRINDGAGSFCRKLLIERD